GSSSLAPLVRSRFKIALAWASLSLPAALTAAAIDLVKPRRTSTSAAISGGASLASSSHTLTASSTRADGRAKSWRSATNLKVSQNFARLARVVEWPHAGANERAAHRQAIPAMGGPRLPATAPSVTCEPSCRDVTAIAQATVRE